MKRMKRKKIRQNGETLVETIVSFSVVLLVLTMITAVVRFAGRLNARTTENAAALEASCTAIEHGEHTGETVQSTLELTLPDGTALSFPIDIYGTDLLTYFAARTQEGG